MPDLTTAPAGIVRAHSDIRLLVQEAIGFIRSGDEQQAKRLAFYREAGIRFWKIKDAAGHGEFGKILAEKFPELQPRRIQRWMKLAKYDVNNPKTSDLVAVYREICGNDKEPLGDSPFREPGDEAEPGRTSRTKKAKGGRKLFDWQKYNQHYSAVYRVPEKLSKVYEGEGESPERKRATELLDELAEVMTKWRKRIEGAK